MTAHEISNLRIASYNCFSIRRKINAVRDLLESHDILLCQETILCEEDCGILLNINPDFRVFYTPSSPPAFSSDGRPEGGMCMFLRRALDLNLHIMSETKNYCLAKLFNRSQETYIFNIYSPTDNRSDDCLILFQNVLGEIQSLINDIDSSNLILVGDFNSDWNRGRFWPYLAKFIEENSLLVGDNHLPADTFTYLSPSHNTTSWIDHVIISSNIQIRNVAIMYNHAVFDHFPLSFSLKFFSISRGIIEDEDYHVMNEFVDWSLFDETAVLNYNNSILSQISPFSLCFLNRDDSNYQTNIDIFYNKFVDALKNSSDPFKFTRKSNDFKLVPGWNEVCKDKYKNARISFLNWVHGGKIRSGFLYNEMKLHRKIFRESLDFCKKNEQKIRDLKLAASAQNLDKKRFWKEVNLRRSHKTRESDIIDNLTNKVDITSLFAKKFSSVTGGNAPNFEIFSCLGARPVTYFRLADVKQAINKLKVGLGFDGIHSNHLKYLDNRVMRILAEFFNACLHHSYLPSAMLRGFVTPRVKNKLGNLQDSNNYREIMRSSNIFKVFEYTVLPILLRYNPLSQYQFGYRANTSTTLATALLKETIGEYINSGSLVYACFLDLSKAFEHVEHDLLLRKLCDNGTPSFIVNILRAVFINTTVSVSYNNHFSEPWFITRGLRQGGVLSAYLFCIYIDDILKTTSRLPYYCRIGLNRVNIQAYADDIVLFCPSSSGLEYLLNHVYAEISSHLLKLNAKKTKIVVFRRSRVSISSNLKFSVVGESVEILNEFKYLGSILHSNLNEKSDIARVKDSFCKSVGMFFRKFHSVKLEIKLKLLQTLCMTFYGSEVWLSRKGCSTVIRQFSVAYHAALKKLLGLPKYISNHYVCSILDLFTFEHFLNSNLINFFKWLSSCNSPCFITHKLYFLKHSYFGKCVDALVFSAYEFTDVLNNDKDAIVSRIKFVQNSERTSYFLGL